MRGVPAGALACDPGQFEGDALICPERVEFLSSTDGAGGHCGGLGHATWANVVYDWLDETAGPAA